MFKQATHAWSSNKITIKNDVPDFQRNVDSKSRMCFISESTELARCTST